MCPELAVHDRLSPSDEVILTALVAGHTQVEAASAAGVSERTVRRRLEDPHFLTHFRRTSDDVVRRVTAQLSELGQASVATLAELLDSDSSPQIRLRAAQTVLSLARDYRLHEELRQRLDHLEDALTGGPDR